MVRKGATSGVRKNAKSKASRKVTHKYFVNASIPVEDGIFDLDHFEQYVMSRFKVGNRTDNLGTDVRFFKKENALHCHAEVDFAKRYLKYLTKKYLKKQELKDYLRVVSTGNKPGNRGYELKYFNIAGDKEEEEEAPEAEEEQ